ncbi:MAG: transcriptional regulator [Sporichthyaceae bacterium]
MYDVPTRRRTLELIAAGASLNPTSKQTGINRATLRGWKDSPDRAIRTATRSTCCRCSEAPCAPEDLEAYRYLLGLYLGDGCLSKAANKDVWVLRISCDDNWPGLQNQCETAIARVLPGNRVGRVAAIGCHSIHAYSKHWPCLFPQHGPGRKHERPIVLEPWQRGIIEADPRPFVRGLFHSDGCRITNWTVRQLAAGPKRYEYPRYFFGNESADIIGLCTWALDLLGIAWRRPKYNTVSVARREAVLKLDEFVGPKH